MGQREITWEGLNLVEEGAVSQGTQQLLEAGDSPQFIARRKTSTSVLQPQEIGFCQQTKRVENQLFPRTSRKESSLLTSWFCPCEAILEFWYIEL